MTGCVYCTVRTVCLHTQFRPVSVPAGRSVNLTTNSLATCCLCSSLKYPILCKTAPLPQGNGLMFSCNWLSVLKCATMYCRVLVTTNGGQSPASHCGGPGSIPGQFMRYLSWTKWHWQRGFSLPVLLFPPALLFRQCPILLSIYMLFLAEGRTGEDWEPFKSSYLTEIREH